MKSKLHKVAVQYQTETPLAVCIRETDDEGPLFGGGETRPRDVWLPLAEIEITGDRQRGGIVEITAPKWLLKEKGLI